MVDIAHGFTEDTEVVPDLDSTAMDCYQEESLFSRDTIRRTREHLV